jgi:hypothetical protein
MNQEAQAREGADLVQQTMPGRAADLEVPMLVRRVPLMTPEPDRADQGQVPMLHDADQEHAGEAPAGRRKRTARRGADVAGAAARQVRRRPTQRRDAVLMALKAPERMVLRDDDDPLATRRDPGREARRECLGTMVVLLVGAGGQDRTVRNGLAAASARLAAPVLRGSAEIRQETDNEDVIEEPIVDHDSPEALAASAVQVPAVDDRECAMVLDRAVSPEAQDGGDRAALDLTVSVVGRAATALPDGGQDSVLATVAGREAVGGAVAILVLRAALQISVHAVLARLVWAPGATSMDLVASVAPGLIARDGAALADQDLDSRVLIVRAVSTVVRGAMVAVAVHRAVSVATAVLVRMDHEGSAAADLMVLEVLAVAWGADLVAVAGLVAAADSPAPAGLASTAARATATVRRSTKTSIAVRSLLAQTIRVGIVTNYA